MILPVQPARQAPPRNLATGHMENQLIGRPPLHQGGSPSKSVQSYGDGFVVIQIPEPPPPARPDSGAEAPYAQGPGTPPPPQPLEERGRRPDYATDGDEDDYFHPHARPKSKRKARGEANGRAVLTEQNVQQIRALFVEDISIKKIARLFGVSRTTVRKILQGVTWATDRFEK